MGGGVGRMVVWMGGGVDGRWCGWEVVWMGGGVDGRWCG